MPMSDSPSGAEEPVGKKDLERNSAMELGDPLEAEESVPIQLEDDVEDEARAVRFDVPEKEEDGDGNLLGAHDDSCAGPLKNDINKGSEVSMNCTKSDQQMGESSASSPRLNPSFLELSHHLLLSSFRSLLHRSPSQTIRRAQSGATPRSAFGSRSALRSTGGRE